MSTEENFKRFKEFFIVIWTAQPKDALKTQKHL